MRIEKMKNPGEKLFTTPAPSDFEEDHVHCIKNVVNTMDYFEAFPDSFDVYMFAAVSEPDIDFNNEDRLHYLPVNVRPVNVRKSAMILKTNPAGKRLAWVPSVKFVNPNFMGWNSIQLMGININWMSTVFELFYHLVNGMNIGHVFDKVINVVTYDFMYDEALAEFGHYDDAAIEVFIDGIIKSGNSRLIKMLVGGEHDFYMPRITNYLLDNRLVSIVWKMKETVYLDMVQYYNEHGQYEKQLQLTDYWSQNPDKPDPMDKFNL